MHEIRKEDLLLRRINIRQVEGEGFQEIPQQAFKDFKTSVRDTIDKPLLEELFPLGGQLCDVHWETHDGRTRLPKHQEIQHTSESCRGKAGITFGRQIGAYPILIGAQYHIPLETKSNIIITGHGARSITGVEMGMNHDNISQKQLEAIPGIGEKSAWKLISQRVKMKRKDGNDNSYESPKNWFEQSKIDWSDSFERFFE